MNRLMREHGFGISLAIGIALIALGVISMPILLVPGAVFVLLGVVAQPVDEIKLGRSSLHLRWQRQVIEAVEQRVAQTFERQAEDRLTISDRAEATVANGSGNVVVTPGTARLRLRGHSPIVTISRVQTPDEFAELIVEQILKPLATTTHDVPTPNPDAHPDA